MSVLDDILGAAREFEELNGVKSTQLLMGQGLADQLGVEGQPVQYEPVDVAGICWWRTVFPTETAD